MLSVSFFLVKLFPLALFRGFQSFLPRRRLPPEGAGPLSPGPTLLVSWG